MVPRGPWRIPRFSHQDVFSFFLEWPYRVSLRNVLLYMNDSFGFLDDS